MKRLILGIITLGIALCAALAPATPAFAQNLDASKAAVCNGLSATTGTTCGAGGGADKKVNDTLGLVINIFSAIVGIAAVIMIIVGGFRYVISAGDGSNTAAAKNTILYAIVGLIVVALAQVIVRFVLHKAT